MNSSDFHRLQYIWTGMAHPLFFPMNAAVFPILAATWYLEWLKMIANAADVTRETNK